jgi:hypothetical protein
MKPEGISMIIPIKPYYINHIKPYSGWASEILHQLVITGDYETL